MAAEIDSIMRSAQAAIVGSLLIDAACVGDVMSASRSEDFSAPELRRLYEAARELWTENKPIDAVTVVARAGKEYRDLAVSCMDETPTAANVLSYCETLRERAALMRMQAGGLAIATAQTLKEAGEALEAVETERMTAGGMDTVTTAQMFQNFFRRMSAPPDYMEFGMSFFDSELFVRRKNYGIIAARPGEGKTALALQIAFTMGRKYRVGYFSLEMSQEDIEERVAAMYLGVDLRDIKKHSVTPQELADLTPTAAHGSTLNVELIRSAGRSMAEIRSVALARRYDVVIIDYIQLVKPRRRFKDNTPAELSEVSQDARLLADAGVLVLAVAQLHRPEGKKTNAWPTLSDLKGSGQFEQDTDFVILIGSDDEDPVHARTLILAKNRNGEAGMAVRCKFDGSHQRFRYVGPATPPSKKTKEKPKPDPNSKDPDWKPEPNDSIWVSIPEGKVPREELPF